MRGARALLAAVMLAVVFPVAGAAVGPCTATASSQTRDVNIAGLVIQFDDARVEEFCVSFVGDSITGLELLQRSGFEVVVEDFGANGVAVCRIDGIGCDHPIQPCFCRCEDPNADCVLWGYYTIQGPGSTWTFSQVGAAQRPVRDGDVDGWRFAAQRPDGGTAPRDADLAGVCARGRQIAVGETGAPGGRGTPSPAAAVVFGLIIAALAWLTWRRAPRRWPIEPPHGPAEPPDRLDDGGDPS